MSIIPTNEEEMRWLENRIKDLESQVASAEAAITDACRVISGLRAEIALQINENTELKFKLEISESKLKLMNNYMEKQQCE